MSDGQLSAAAMARVVATDPQFTVPVRPCLVPGLVRVALDDGLAFVGTGSRQTVLRGRSATTLLPRLLPALDGTRTVAELASTLPDVTEADLRACVSVLYVSGVLQEGPAGPSAGPLLDHLGRHLDTTRVNRSRHEAAERLTGTRVLVAGPEPLATRLRAELVGSGVDAHAWTAPAEGDLVVAVDDGDAGALADLDLACARVGASWLRTAVGDRTVELGPMFNARYTCCYGCFAADGPRSTGRPSPDRVAAWAALATTEVVHLLSRVGTARVRRLHRGRPRGLDAVDHRRVPPAGLPSVPARRRGGATRPGPPVRAGGGVRAARVAQPQGPPDALPAGEREPPAVQQGVPGGTADPAAGRSTGNHARPDPRRPVRTAAADGRPARRWAAGQGEPVGADRREPGLRPGLPARVRRGRTARGLVLLPARRPQPGAAAHRVHNGQ
ncbi:hypothetical protein ACFQX7_04655 [Luedemannella flava]